MSSGFEVSDAASQITVLVHQPLAFLRQISQLAPEFFVVAGIEQQLARSGCVTQAFLDLVQFSIEWTGHFVVQRSPTEATEQYCGDEESIALPPWDSESIQ